MGMNTMASREGPDEMQVELKSEIRRGEGGAHLKGKIISDPKQLPSPDQASDRLLL